MNKVVVILFLFFSLVLYGCKNGDDISQFEFTEKGEIHRTLIFDNTEREYIVYIPEIYDGSEAVPLLFNFHGYTGQAELHMTRGDFRSIADTAGFILVHPQGLPDRSNNTHWNDGNEVYGDTVDDVGFTAKLIEILSKEYKIDKRRIYSAGMSNGGFFSYHLAIHLNDMFAAIASVTGCMKKEMLINADPKLPVAIMEIHGTSDAVVPYEGNSMFYSVDQTLEYWLEFNDCDTNAVVTELPDINTDDNSTVVHYLYPAGENGYDVELYKVVNGYHTWPGGGFTFQPTNFDFDASLAIWNFFRKYSR